MIGRGCGWRGSVVAASLAVTLSPTLVRAQVLVSQAYGIDAGLANNTVGSVFQDSKGYLWLSTAEGLSRYDGRVFVNYGTSDGLPHAVVHAVAEDRWGHLWVSTFDGLARLVEGPSAEQVRNRFERVDLGVRGQPQRLVATPDGALWCFTAAGLLRGYPDTHGRVAFSTAVPAGRLPASLPQSSQKVVVDQQQRVWTIQTDAVATVGGAPERRVPVPPGVNGGMTLAADADGRLLLGRGAELYELENEDRGTWRRLPIALPAGSNITTLAVDRRGLLWVGTTTGVFGWRRGAYADHPLLGPPGVVSDILVDRQQNLWATTFGNGVVKVSRDLIVTYPTDSLLGADRVNHVLADAGGHVYGVAHSGTLFDIESNAVRLLARRAPPLETVYRRILQDRRGRWWALSDNGLFFSDAPRPGTGGWRRAGTVRPERVDNPIGPALFEEPGGVLWIGGVRDALYRVDLSARRPEPQPVAMTPSLKGLPARMALDRSGALWLADGGHLWRLRGRALETLDKQPGLPETLVRSMYLDARGWLWVGLRYGGLSVSKNPSADHPTFVNYSTANGLRSNTIHAMTADAYGRMYLVTGRGLDRLDPADGRVRHYDDLGSPAASSLQWLMTGRDGRIWAATNAGVVRIDPDVDRVPPPAPPVYFTRLEAAGEPVPIAARSVTEVTGLQLPASRNTLRLEFASLNFDVGPERYQYRLDGIDRTWSAPTTTRLVDYPRLPPGRYRFLVRALNESDEASPPAVATVVVLPPFWRTWWFLTIAAGVATAAGASVYRQRRQRRRALERVRRQVAQDVHDEMGSGLAQIAVLSEVARRDAAVTPAALADIAGVARDMRVSMTDIVWAIDPGRDRLDDLVVRMRQVAVNLCEADGVPFEFAVPPREQMQAISIAPDRRRHFLLVFKEAVTNAARHSGAMRVSAGVAVEGRHLTMTIEDNGRGFDASSDHDGNGVRSLRQRAQELGGVLEIRSGPEGTRIALRAPIAA